ncbi:TPA: hypothetical protein MX306_004632 [Citrobacter freundii]|nr:hypothetical protein [Citrobacter freundii]
MTKYYLQNAPRGVTAIQLDNGEEAIYLNGEFIACCDLNERDDPVIGMGEILAEKIGVPFRLLTLPVPDDEEWSWNDVTDSLKWGPRVVLSRMMMRPVLECCINHITLEDHNILDNIVFWDEDSGWLMNTGVGYLIRLDAVTNPLHRLKKMGISRTTRAFIFCAIRQADVSMIHFSAVCDHVEGAPVFEW